MSRIRIKRLVTNQQLTSQPVINGNAVTSSGAELNILDGALLDVDELNLLNGVTASTAELNKTDGITGYLVQAAEVTFTETSGAGVWTGSVTLPAGSTLLDIIVNNVALWDSETSADMDVGDAATPSGYFAGIDLKATDLLAGESISFGLAGAYIANSHVSPRYAAAQRVISGIVTKVGTTGTAGRTRMTVVWSLPAAATAATKV
jgi:hypothetical protein